MEDEIASLRLREDAICLIYLLYPLSYISEISKVHWKQWFTWKVNLIFGLIKTFEKNPTFADFWKKSDWSDKSDQLVTLL